MEFNILELGNPGTSAFKWVFLFNFHKAPNEHSETQIFESLEAFVKGDPSEVSKVGIVAFHSTVDSSTLSAHEAKNYDYIQDRVITYVDLFLRSLVCKVYKLEILWSTDYKPYGDPFRKLYRAISSGKTEVFFLDMYIPFSEFHPDFYSMFILYSTTLTYLVDHVVSMHLELFEKAKHPNCKINTIHSSHAFSLNRRHQEWNPKAAKLRADFMQYALLRNRKITTEKMRLQACERSDLQRDFVLRKFPLPPVDVTTEEEDEDED